MEILNDMRQGKFLFVILFLVGVNEVLGQDNLFNTSGNVSIGITTPLAKLHVSNAGASAIFQNANTTAGAGYVGIGGLSTSFATGSLPTNLLHLRDGNMWIQRGTFRVSAVNVFDDAILVSTGIARLSGGVYAGAQTQGLSGSMEYSFNQGYFELSSRANTNNYQFKIGSRINNVDLGSPVLSTNTNMLFQINSGSSPTPYTFKFLNGNTELATLDNNGSLSLMGGLMGDIVLKTADPARKVKLVNNSTAQRALVHGWNDDLIINFQNDFEGGVKIQSRVDIGDKVYAPSDATVKLAVAGTVVAQKVKVTAATNWGDFVFDKSYTLQTLAEVEQYVKANKRLPNIPSATEIEANGIDTGEMLRLQMIKIEELTLHLIEQQKEMQEMKTQLENLKSK